MQVYTYSDARQQLAEVLDEADSSGKILIRRRDGRTYSLTPEEQSETSPLDVPSIKSGLSKEELISSLRAGRSKKDHTVRLRHEMHEPYNTKY